MRITIVGTGYVGLVTGACFAEKGHHVYCVDIDENRVDIINKGEAPFFENGLPELLKKKVHKNLFATTELKKSIADSDLTFIAVGTPFDGQEIDLSYIKAAAIEIGQILQNQSNYHVVVVKSTVVPGTTDEFVLNILERESGKKTGKDFGICMNPEFLTEGQAIKDFMSPDRIVIGGIDQKSIESVYRIYNEFSDIPIIKTTTKTADFIKYASNAMLATQISFANELANLSSLIEDVDITDVMRGVHLSAYLRISTAQGEIVQAPISSFLEAGCGFGGSCLPKDVSALIAYGSKKGSDMRLLKSVMGVNDNQPMQILNILKDHYKNISGVKIAILGLAFKPDTNDMRQSPAIKIIKLLNAENAEVHAHDPVAITEAKKIFTNKEVKLHDDLEECISGMDAVVLVTKWGNYANISELINRINPEALIVDGRRFIPKNEIKNYRGIGLGR